MLLFHSTILIRLSVSALLGLIIGLEREIRKKPLGLKTSLVICISSCLLTMVSIESAEKFAKIYVNVMDPMRLAAQIVSGIGFLGAGVILRKSNDVILGLTTAAMIWAASGLGIAAGAGFFKEAFLALALIILSVEIIPSLIKRFGVKSLQTREISVRVGLPSTIMLDDFLSSLSEAHIAPERLKIESNAELTTLIITTSIHEKASISEVYTKIKQIPFVQSLDIETL